MSSGFVNAAATAKAGGAAPTGPVTSHEEAWKYTPVSQVVTRVEHSVNAQRWLDPVTAQTVAEALSSLVDRPRMVFVNGFYRAELSDHLDLPDGLWCGLAGPHHPPSELAGVQTEPDRTIEGLLERAAGDGHDVATVIVDAGVQVFQPVHIVHVALPGEAGSASVMSHPRTIIELGAGSRLAVVETYRSVARGDWGDTDDFAGSDAVSFVAPAGLTVTDAFTAIRVADGAELDHCRVQIESSAATHIGQTRIEQAAHTKVRMTSITGGADIARNAIDVHLEGNDSTADLAGINMTSARQRHDTVISVDHGASHCASNQRFAGVVDDHGKSSFSGEIVVRPGTKATDAHQTNRNLLLSPTAEADSRPWLQILADDVQCTHGSTVGRLDDDALFYLRTRGIAEPEARAMLTDAFIRELIDAISHHSIRAHVDEVMNEPALAHTSIIRAPQSPASRALGVAPRVAALLTDNEQR